MEVKQTITMREFEIRISEKELSALMDLMNWNKERLEENMALCFFESYGSIEDAVELVYNMFKKFEVEYKKEV